MLYMYTCIYICYIILYIIYYKLYIYISRFILTSLFLSHAGARARTLCVRNTLGTR